MVAIKNVGGDLVYYNPATGEELFRAEDSGGLTGISGGGGVTVPDDPDGFTVRDASVDVGSASFGDSFTYEYLINGSTAFRAVGIKQGGQLVTGLDAGSSVSFGSKSNLQNKFRLAGNLTQNDENVFRFIAPDGQGGLDTLMEYNTGENRKLSIGDFVHDFVNDKSALNGDLFMDTFSTLVFSGASTLARYNVDSGEPADTTVGYSLEHASGGSLIQIEGDADGSGGVQAGTERTTIDSADVRRSAKSYSGTSSITVPDWISVVKVDAAEQGQVNVDISNRETEQNRVLVYVTSATNTADEVLVDGNSLSITRLLKNNEHVELQYIDGTWETVSENTSENVISVSPSTDSQYSVPEAVDSRGLEHVNFTPDGSNDFDLSSVLPRDGRELTIAHTGGSGSPPTISYSNTSVLRGGVPADLTTAGSTLTLVGADGQWQVKSLYQA
jgi:hypothetical protein